MGVLLAFGMVMLGHLVRCSFTHALTSVAETLAEMLPVMKKLHQDRNLEFELQIADSAIKFCGEQKDLQEMLGNLLDNACKWATTKIQIKVEQQQQGLLISIEDDGQGVPAGLQQQILQRGVRADEKVQGSGLGLAIVADLAQLYQGNLQVSKSTLGGLKAQLIFSL